MISVSTTTQINRSVFYTTKQYADVTFMLRRAKCHRRKGNKYRVTVTMEEKSTLQSNYSLLAFMTQKETLNC